MLFLILNSFILLGLADAQCAPVNSPGKGTSHFSIALTKQPSSTPPPPPPPSPGSPPPPVVATPPPFLPPPPTPSSPPSPVVATPPPFLPPPPPPTPSSPPPPVAASPPPPSPYSPPPPKEETPPPSTASPPPPEEEGETLLPPCPSVSPPPEDESSAPLSPPPPPTFSPPPPPTFSPPPPPTFSPPPPAPTFSPPPPPTFSPPPPPTPVSTPPPPPTFSPPPPPTPVSTPPPPPAPVSTPSQSADTTSESLVSASSAPASEDGWVKMPLTENSMPSAGEVVAAYAPASLGSGPFQLKTICNQLTSYPDICESTIVSFLGGHTTVDDMMVFLQASIKVAVNETNAAMDLVTDYEGRATSPQMQSKLKGCKKDFHEALENIQTAVGAIPSGDYGTLSTYLSSAITAYTDCDDELSGINPLKDTNERLRNVVDNALAIAEGMHWP
ncbi:hypothetical protein SAY86_013244 [Trapa natans]|uniref:Pectinesterase inhibitor domain-containing protein n=1 Tax=Trapa natans TaxID=22666 RepID=A0AAN7ME81_TRANT|nr:hypothetical protein SAY86_013244 [Trapa natans]